MHAHRHSMNEKMQADKCNMNDTQSAADPDRTKDHTPPPVP